MEFAKEMLKPLSVDQEFVIVLLPHTIQIFFAINLNLVVLQLGRVVLPPKIAVQAIWVLFPVVLDILDLMEIVRELMPLLPHHVPLGFVVMLLVLQLLINSVNYTKKVVKVQAKAVLLL